ncbi:hypothetical protein HPB47_027397 [Ixodes persulcatus]|uniref:Uncharacterized protein n=1 Tax=Ixodes persulcatus TaxID=34615 RepID=A0AC60PW62_IXOPE|nr:hypothetical protein HPB47_027397 [Ixodes persulcatus]
MPSCGATSQVRAALQDRLPHQQQLLERYATLMIDEMQLTPSLVYDASSGTVLGRPTLALADGTIPHHCLTNMGGNNLGVWKEFSITVSRHGRHRVSCPHPCDASRQLFFMADVPHLLKNLRNHLTKHDEAVAFLRSIVNLFEAISIESSEKPVWKPIQTGIILSTTSALQDQKLYLNEMDFKFLLLSRLTQDSLENLFSTLRSKNPVPRPTEFRCALRHATMAQFLRPSKDGSYTDDQGFLLAGIPSKDAPKAGDGSIATPEELLDLELPEQESLQYLAGYVVRKVKQNLTCNLCIAALTGDGEANRLTQLKSYTKERLSLTVPSAPVVQVVEHAEAYFRNNQSSLVMNNISLLTLPTLAFKVAPKPRLSEAEGKRREEEARQPASQKDRLGDPAAGRAFLVGWSSVFSSRRRSAAA